MAANPQPRLRKLVSASGVYLIGGIAQQSIGFLMLPVYTSFLDTTHYGILEILNTIGLISLMLLSVGLPSAIVKVYHRDCSTHTEKEAILPVSLLLSLPTLLVGCLLVLLGSSWLSTLLLGSAGNSRLIELLALWIFLNCISMILLAFFRAREEALIYASISFSQFFLLLVLNIYFVYFLQLGVAGILWGNILSHASIILLSIPLLRKRAKLAFPKALVKPLLTFGLLVIPTAIAGWVMGVSDRYFIAHFGQLSEVGVYSVGYKFGMVLQFLVVTPFQLAWPAFAFSISEAADHRFVYARTLTYLSVISVFGWLVLSELTEPLLRIMVNQAYVSAYKVVPMIAAAYVFYGIHFCVSPGIHIKGKSKYIPLLVVGASLVNLLLNVLMIPRFGIMGAGWATTVSFSLLGISTILIAKTVYPINYEYARIAKVAAAGIVLYAGSLFVHTNSLATMIAWRITIIMAFPLLLLALQFLEADEKRFMLKTFRRQVARLQPTRI